MHRSNLVLALAGLAFCISCDRQSDFITETSPFLEVKVQTPTDGKVAIVRRAERFAKQHGMKVHFVPDHFEQQEFTLSLTRTDLNIVAGNVRFGALTVVTAYTGRVPTGAQRTEVESYLCEVMRHRCSR